MKNLSYRKAVNIITKRIRENAKKFRENEKSDRQYFRRIDSEARRNYRLFRRIKRLSNNFDFY